MFPCAKQSPVIPVVPPRRWLVLAQDRVVKIRKTVASNLSTSPELLVLLAYDVEVSIRLGSGEASACPPPALHTLASDADASIREAIAMHPMADAHLLNALARDDSLRIRRAVAMNASAAQGCRRAPFARQASFGQNNFFHPTSTVDQDTLFRLTFEQDLVCPQSGCQSWCDAWKH